MRLNSRRWSLLTYILDLALLMGALKLADWARHVLPIGQEVEPNTVFLTPLLYVVLLGLWSFFGRASRLYEGRRYVTIDVELQRLVISLALTLFGLAAGLFLFKYQQFSRLLYLYFAAFGLVFLTSYRLALWGLWEGLRRWGYGSRRAILVGGGELAERVVRAFEEPWSRLRWVGMVGDSPVCGIPVLGSLKEVAQVALRERAEEVVIALAEERRKQIARVVQDLRHIPVRVKLVPDSLQLATIRASVEEVGGIPLLQLRGPVIEGFDALVKRMLDMALAGVALVLLWPLMLAIAFLIRRDSPGPILFRQERIGENGRPFTLLKFRTMTVDAPPVAPVPLEPARLGQSTIKVAPDDPRVTRIGRILRRYSLDELPQLWNVLKGEMSLVGPRPEVTPVVRMYDPRHMKRLAVKPGLTGPMQINGRSDLTLDQRVKLELAYIENYSLWQDLKILFQTASAVLSGRGAY